MTEERDDRHVRRIADALRGELDDSQDPEALARLAGAALGDEVVDEEPETAEDDSKP